MNKNKITGYLVASLLCTPLSSGCSAMDNKNEESRAQELPAPHSPDELTLKIKEVETEYLSAVHKITNRFISEMKEDFPEFGYNEESVKIINRLIEIDNSDANTKGRLILVYGSYLGEVIIKERGGKWVSIGEFGYGVQIDENTVLFPFEKVKKHFSNGNEDSIYAFYLYMKNLS